MLRLVEIGIPWEVVAELSEMDLQMVAIIKASLLEADQSASNKLCRRIKINGNGANKKIIPIKDDVRCKRGIWA